MKFHWLLTATPGENEMPAIEIVDLGSGGYLILRAADGVELDRHLPGSAGGLAALFDALAASPPPSP